MFFRQRMFEEVGTVRRIGRLVVLALAAITTGAAALSSAMAQVPENNGFLAHIDGRWRWLGGDRIANALVTERPWHCAEPAP